MCYAFNKYIKNTSSKIKNFYQLASASSNTYSLWENYGRCDTSISYTETMEEKKSDFRTHINNIIKKYNVDAFIYPTHTIKVLKIGENNSYVNSYKIAPVLGLPAVSVPLGFDSDGLSYGIEFMGAKNSENVLYEIISEYEKINSNYELPSIAPALYTIPKTVNELKELYEVMLGNDEYLVNRLTLTKQKEELKKFFLNYNENEDKGEAARYIYEKSISSLEHFGYSYNKESKTIEKTGLLKAVRFVFYILIIYFLYKVLKILPKTKKKH